MRTVLQKVSSASVSVDNRQVSTINQGLLCLLGVHKDDNELKCAEMAKKINNLRIFEDKNGKMNLSINQINGEILVVSQFTLYANCAGGNRPSFTNAMEPVRAKSLYERFMSELQSLGVKTKAGIFGAKMNVNLVNNGPVTIILDL